MGTQRLKEPSHADLQRPAPLAHRALQRRATAWRHALAAAQDAQE
jgi:hypothetical protein